MAVLSGIYSNLKITVEDVKAICNKTFQFAVLGDEMLYITENPPRSLKDIQIKLDLACVTSVELVSWSRSFLLLFT